MKTVCIGSAFRNSSGVQIRRYFSQVEALRAALGAGGIDLFLGLVEGDSRDSTRRDLEHAMGPYRGSLLDRSHGGPVYGSTEQPERFRALQGVGNGILESCPGDVDALVYVESDLLWDAATIVSLLERLDKGRVDCVAPLIMAGNHFYDVFAFRGLDGGRFAPFKPYHREAGEAGAVEDDSAPAGVKLPGGILEVSSAGSCLVMRAEMAWTCRVPPEDGLVGFCRDARSQGYRIWADFDRIVRHP